MKDPQDVMPDHSASAMRALGEMCFKLFSDPRFEKRNFQAAYDLAKELLSLDYSPVMRHFLERGLHTVKYYSDIDGFVFTFNAGSALHFTRGDKVWAMTGDEDLVRRGTIKPQPLTATGVSAALAPISNCPLCSSIVVSTDRYCHHCAYDLSQVYPGTPVSVLMCPGCGSVGCFNGSQCAACGYPAAQAKQPAPAPMPGLAPGGSWDPGPAVRMRCPGGCGSEIIGVYPASPDGENPFKSLCPYSCKVRVEVWNKKLQEAKKR